MSDSIKVSIIIPNYNHKRFLEQRIISILNQTYQDFEIIILDDASSDGSQELIKEYVNHPKVSHVEFNNNNSGSVFKQWVKGVQFAKGDFVWIAESDDFAENSFLETTVNVLNTNTKLGLVFTDSNKIDEKGMSLGLVSKNKKILASTANNDVVISKSNFAKYLLTHLIIVNASSVLFRKKALESINFQLLKEFKNTGDIFTYVGIALNFDLFYFSQPLNNMRLHENNTTKKNKNNGKIYGDKILLLDYYLNEFNKLPRIRQDVFSFLKSFFFLSLDFGYKKPLLRLITKMLDVQFINRKSYIRIKAILFFYNIIIHNGKPYMVRDRFKSLLNNAI
ncbi:glycosyltransferase family 2 protein [uncultured Winogradskyella sp.]|uniref:glycosyltransferase family 2 protein n=1 Tax=uncultured Winogradskyella sp. TaxID=395353 RepID=UPI00262A20FE|nr:glycosyltransferase family 2 protein [uncultured Winogradskyella sp.]